MGEFFTAPKLLEIGFDTLSAATALFVGATALRLSSSFTLSAHRRAMRVLAAPAVVVMTAEVVGVAVSLTRPSILRLAAGEFAELVRRRGGRGGRGGRFALPVPGGAGGDSTPQTLRQRGRSDRGGQPLVLRAGREPQGGAGHEAGDEVLRHVAGVSSPTWPMPWWYWVSS